MIHFRYSVLHLLFQQPVALYEAAAAAPALRCSNAALNRDCTLELLLMFLRFPAQHNVAIVFLRRQSFGYLLLNSLHVVATAGSST